MRFARSSIAWKSEHVPGRPPATPQQTSGASGTWHNRRLAFSKLPDRSRHLDCRFGRLKLGAEAMGGVAGDADTTVNSPPEADRPQRTNAAANHRPPTASPGQAAAIPRRS